MKATALNFHSTTTKQGQTERLSTQEDSIAGFSNLPKSKIDRIHKERNMSPKSVKRKVNTFIETKVLNNSTATAVVFEELCKYTRNLLSHFFSLSQLPTLPKSIEPSFTPSWIA